jgi:hypothetical protein
MGTIPDVCQTPVRVSPNAYSCKKKMTMSFAIQIIPVMFFESGARFVF